MKKIVKLLIFMMVLTLVLPNMASASEGKTATYHKFYELDEDTKNLKIVIENFDAPYKAVMTVPGGNKIEAKVATIKGDNGNIYRAIFTINNAPKGKYTFELVTDRQTYFGLYVDVALFWDINNHWAQDAISSFMQQGIVNGFSDDSFKPNQQVTGEQLIKMLVLALTEENPSGNRQWITLLRWNTLDAELQKEMGFSEYDFSNVTMKSWEVPYLDAIKTLKVLDKWTDKELKNGFTRKDVAMLLANVMKLTEVPKSYDKVKDFSDTKDLSKEVKEAIKLLSNYSILEGYSDGTFKPNKVVTRAEAVVLLAKLQTFYK